MEWRESTTSLGMVGDYPAFTNSVLFEYIFDSIGTTNKFFVELGTTQLHVWLLQVQTQLFFMRKAGTAFCLTRGHENATINLHRHFLCPSNIFSVFELREVPANPDYISIDIDGQDPWLFREVVRDYRYRPRVVSVEFNVAFPRTAPMVIAGFGECGKSKHAYAATRMNSATPEVLRRSGGEAGSALMHVEGDAFFVRSELIDGEPPLLKDLPALKANNASCFIAPWESRITNDMLKSLWDYNVWVATADAEQARKAAQDIVLAAEKECGFKLTEL